jgi:hypothetical protein
MIFSVIVVFEALVTEIPRAEESCKAGDGVRVVVVNEVQVNTWTLILTRAGNELVSQSGTDHHHAHSQHFFKRLYVI